MLVDGVRGHLSRQTVSEPPWLTARYMSKNRPDAGTFDIPIQRAIFGLGLSPFFKSKAWVDLGLDVFCETATNACSSLSLPNLYRTARPSPRDEPSTSVVPSTAEPKIVYNLKTVYNSR